MQALLEVILPVFLVIGSGYAAVWRGLISRTGVDGLMGFTQNFAIPCLLFRAISTLDLGAGLRPAAAGQLLRRRASPASPPGSLGARLLFRRPVAGQRRDRLLRRSSRTRAAGPADHRARLRRRRAGGELRHHRAARAVLLLRSGSTAMEVARAGGGGRWRTGRAIADQRDVPQRAGHRHRRSASPSTSAASPLPARCSDALDLMVRAALPAALFGLGGVLVRYRPEGDARDPPMHLRVSLVLHPAIVLRRWALDRPGRGGLRARRC